MDVDIENFDRINQMFVYCLLLFVTVMGVQGCS